MHDPLTGMYRIPSPKARHVKKRAKAAAKELRFLEDLFAPYFTPKLLPGVIMLSNVGARLGYDVVHEYAKARGLSR